MNYKQARCSTTPHWILKKETFLITEECCRTACLWRRGNNFFKGKLKNLNLEICIFTQGLNVKQVFYCYIVVILVFILDSFLAKLLVVIFLYLNVNEPEGNTMYYLTLPYLTSVMCVNLSFAMVLDNTTSPDYQLCVKTSAIMK